MLHVSTTDSHHFINVDDCENVQKTYDPFNKKN